MLAKVLIIVGSIIVGFFLLCLLLNIIAFHPPRYNKKKYQGDLHENHLDIAKYKPFKSGGCKIRAYLYENSNPKGLIIFCHGIGTSSDYYIPEILKWRSLGYSVYTFDYRGYWTNKGLFKGLVQNVKDLNLAINFIDDGKLPITLMGHSLGGYTVSSVMRLNKSKNIKNIVTISAFSRQLDVLKELYDKLKVPKWIRWFFTGIIKLGQTVFFGFKWKIESKDVVNEHPEINYLVFQSINDKDVLPFGAALYNKKEQINVPNIQYFMFEDKPYDTHMGIIRGGGKGTVNEKLVEIVNSNINKE